MQPPTMLNYIIPNQFSQPSTPRGNQYCTFYQRLILLIILNQHFATISKRDISHLCFTTGYPEPQKLLVELNY